MPGTSEAFSRVKVDAQLKDRGWDVLNTNAVRKRVQQFPLIDDQKHALMIGRAGKGKNERC